MVPPSGPSSCARPAAQTARRYERISELLSLIDHQARVADICLVALKGAELHSLGLYAPGSGRWPMSICRCTRRMVPACRALEALGFHQSLSTPRHRVFVRDAHRKPSSLGEHGDNYLKIELHERIAEALPLRVADITELIYPSEPHAGLNAYPSKAALMTHLLLHAAGAMSVRNLRLMHLNDLARLNDKHDGRRPDLVLQFGNAGRDRLVARLPYFRQLVDYTGVIPERVRHTVSMLSAAVGMDFRAPHPVGCFALAPVDRRLSGYRVVAVACRDPALRREPPVAQQNSVGNATADGEHRSVLVGQQMASLIAGWTFASLDRLAAAPGRNHAYRPGCPGSRPMTSHSAAGLAGTRQAPDGAGLDGHAAGTALLGDTTERTTAPNCGCLPDSPSRSWRAEIQGFELRPGMRVLDAGCGTGEALKWLVDAGVCAGWRSRSLIWPKAHVAAASARTAPTPLVLQADLLRAPFPSHSFDLVWCLNTINHLRDPISGIAAS